MAQVLSHEVHKSSEHFNSIPRFCCAIKSFEEKSVRDLIDNLGGIFLKHKVNEKFGLILNHRHFSLHPDEILVETLGKDGSMSLSLPWILKGLLASPPRQVTEWQELGLCTKSFIIPQTWSFTSDGNLKAYEFMASDKLEELPPPDFVQEIFGALKQYGVENILGLRLLDEATNGEAFEVTPEGKRLSITSHGGNLPTQNGNSAKVLWYFTPEGKLREAMDCTRCGTCFICIG